MTAGAMALEDDVCGTLNDGGFSSLGELVFWVPAAMLGLASSGVCSLGIRGAVGFVVCGAGLLILVVGGADASEGVGLDVSSSITPLLSNTLG